MWLSRCLPFSFKLGGSKGVVPEEKRGRHRHEKGSSSIKMQAEPWPKNEEHHTLFVYQTLQHDEFRLVCLRPGRPHDPIAFELVTFSMRPDQLPFYEAVSYTWGDPSSTVSAVCGASILQITQSVDSLLRRFRWSDEIRCVLPISKSGLRRTDADSK